MGKCINHPDTETPYKCMKHNIYQCEHCLECPDPDIYCKFRTSCPIYFMSKKGFDVEEQEALPVGRETEFEPCTVTFSPGNISVTVPEGSTLLRAAEKADIYINASCNGKGSCGKCRLILEAGKVESTPTALLSDKEKSKGYLLACQTRIFGSEVKVRIPEETIEKKLRAEGMGKEATEKLHGLVEVITPMVSKTILHLPAPTMEDTVSDLDRVIRGLKKNGIDTSKLSTSLKVMQQITEASHKGDWKICVSVLHKKCSSEIVKVVPAYDESVSLGLAIDLGTTSIVVYIVEMETGKILSAASGHNSQAACGDDVINRMVCAEKDGVKKLKLMALSTINNLTKQALATLEQDQSAIENVVISGNTTMVHLLLGLESKYIRREPYIPTVSEFPIIKAGEMGLRAATHAGVFIMPGPASYVGGDIVSGLLYTGFHMDEALTLFIDVGTNGEIVLGNNEFLMTAACSAGPAFEGGGIRWGMRAEDGAIEKITLDPVTFVPTYATVENKPARGICGSGMIDLISEMLLKKVIGQDGKFRLDATHDRMTLFKDELAFILEYGKNLASEEDIIFTESDIRSLVLSKAAIYAGFTVLLDEVGMDFSMVDQMIITGGFGQHLDIGKAVIMGLLPDIERNKFHYKGNSSIAGAYMALLSRDFRQEALTISNNMTYIDFSSSTRFMDEFIKAQFLPHTEMRLFPSVKIK
ncbi:metal-binding protein [Desulforapulum autotrophicum HRM2]|uniref:Metal-binding protein n=1 Tax=Desulforapulum autotrophicum (strain ATCC 43914 / DSM 3382 / VKM B-1955 / HRM2) TaxID=177437 RepID=C0QH84_DESAH|nr:ASKHA domain-containing protein [Desulforapulum autotrophicum]ACN17743.1 metal-binding protein [Desulforapulum autotrophicum HRM2]